MDWGCKETWNYFAGKAKHFCLVLLRQLTQDNLLGKTVLCPGGYFPDDLDTTSLALLALRPERFGVVTSTLDRMLQYINSDGTVQVSREHYGRAHRLLIKAPNRHTSIETECELVR